MNFLKYAKTVRFIQFMAFGACWFHVSMCVSFSLLLPIMVETPTMEGPYGCVNDYDKAGRQVAWTQLEQGYVLAAYGLGYFLAQLASAPAVNTLGARWVVLAATLLGGICTVLLPLAAFHTWVAAFFLRLFTGFAGGVICDSVYTLLERWVSSRYKFNFFFIATAALMLGVVVTWIISAALMKAMSWWILPFLIGGPAILWSVLWGLCVRNAPDSDSNRSGGDLQKEDDETFADYLPMSMMFSSCPFISLIFLYYADMWGISLFFLVMPKFMYEMLGLDIMLTSVLCSLAVCFRFASALILEFLVRLIFKYDILDITSVRKMFVFFSHAFTGVAVITLGYIGCNTSWLAVGVCFTLALSGASSVTSQANARDLSPAFVRIRMEQLQRVIESRDFGEPEFIVVHIGTNDRMHTDHVVGEMYDLITAAKKKFSSPRIYVSGVLRRTNPNPLEAHWELKQWVRLGDSFIGVHFVDPNAWVTESDFGRDGLHLNRRGAGRLGRLFAGIGRAKTKRR